MLTLRKTLSKIPKNGLTPLKMEHILFLILGLALVQSEVFSDSIYAKCNSVGSIIILIVYLNGLVGVAPLPMPVFRSKFIQTGYNGLASGFLDSFIILMQNRKLRTKEGEQKTQLIMSQTENQPTEGVRAQFLALQTIAALIGGLVIWFGEAYAAGLYHNDHRTGWLSALYVLPPVLLFLSIVGLHAEFLPIKVVRNNHTKFNPRDLVEFIIGVALLLATHNPLLCLGILLVYAVASRQDDRLLAAYTYHTEVNVMLVLFLALVAGSWLVTSVIEPLGLNQGTVWPVVPASIQAVLWGPLYEDTSVHFWIRITTLSAGALLLPISSLVGVMLFKSLRQWVAYMKYSIPYAMIWYGIMRSWIWLTLESPIGHFLDQWAHNSHSAH